MNEPNDVSGPHWLTRPVVLLCAAVTMVLIVGVAFFLLWWSSRAGIRAMAAAYAPAGGKISPAARWAEERLSINRALFATDAGVTSIRIQSQDSGFNDDVLLELRHFPNLPTLNLSMLPITDDGVEALVAAGGLQRLEELDISLCNEITGKSIRSLGRLPALQLLQLCGIHCAGGDFAGFDNLQGLRTMHIPFTDADLDVITRLPRLQHLSLVHTEIDDDGMAALAHCPQLKGLNLSSSWLTDDGVRQICEYCPDLKVLVLDETLITDKSLSRFDQFSGLVQVFVRDTAVSEQAIERSQAKRSFQVFTQEDSKHPQSFLLQLERLIP